MATELHSFAKINLGLAIGRTRPDGFHALTTLYQTVALSDIVRVEARRASRTVITLTTNHPRVPTDSGNTAFRMAECALRALGITAEVHIHIEKRLPVQGGLGAGSANAAAALIALERELGARLPAAERLEIAAGIGSDVPLFLIGGAVLGLGRGEDVYPLPDASSLPCVVAVPEIGVSTPAAFCAWDSRHAPASGPAPGVSPGDPALTAPDPAATLRRLSRSIAAAWGEPHSSGVFPTTAYGPLEKRRDLAENPLLALVRTGIANDFEEVVFPQHPLLGEIKCALAGSGSQEDAALYAALSGSGAALFGLYGTEAGADRATERLRVRGIPALRTRTLPRDEYWRDMLREGKG